MAAWIKIISLCMMLVFSANAYAGDLCCDMAISTDSSDNIPCHDDTGLDDREQQHLCADCVSCAHVFYYSSLGEDVFFDCLGSNIVKKDVFFYENDLKPLLKPPNVQENLVKNL